LLAEIFAFTSLSNNLAPFVTSASTLLDKPFYPFPSVSLTEILAFISLSKVVPFFLTSISTSFDEVPAGTETSEDLD
jgi:hypothetical protein